MRFWRNLLTGLLLWTAHFLAVYIIASVWPGTQFAKNLVLVATVLALGIVGWLAVRGLRSIGAVADDFNRWSRGLALLGYALAAAAILYQGLPSILA